MLPMSQAAMSQYCCKVYTGILDFPGLKGGDNLNTKIYLQIITKRKSDTTQVFITEGNVEILHYLEGGTGRTGHSDYCSFPKYIFKKPSSLSLFEPLQSESSEGPLKSTRTGLLPKSQRFSGLFLLLIVVILRFDIPSCHSF